MALIWSENNAASWHYTSWHSKYGMIQSGRNHGFKAKSRTWNQRQICTQPDNHLLPSPAQTSLLTTCWGGELDPPNSLWSMRMCTTAFPGFSFSIGVVWAMPSGTLRSEYLVPCAELSVSMFTA